MVCDCCRRKKKLFESFAAIQTKNGQLNFCVECNDLAYKVRDDANELKSDDYVLHLEQWKKRAKKPSKRFIEWQQAFLAPLEMKLEKSGQQKSE
ncbi:MAG: hypothetical protein GX227_03265 [Clostridiaceae bacterium]|jgi:hypothetical protein|nr:hypothetical protein [Clostridiaceae bacterium]